MLEVLSNLREWGSKISLNLRIDKCQLYFKPGHHLPTIRQGLTVNREGLIILGTPIRSDKFIQESCLTQVHESQLLLDKICELPNIQSAFLMLRYCATGSLAHLTRSVPPHLLEEAATAYDFSLRSTAAKLLNLDYLSDNYWKQMQMPLRYGGMGFTSMVDSAASAYLGSSSICLKELPKKMPSINIEESLSPHTTTLAHLVKSYQKVANIPVFKIYSQDPHV